MGETLLEVRGPQTVAGRMTELTAELQADGRLRLTVAGEQGVERAGAGVLQRQPQEDFCVGTDNGQPVAKYAAGEFRGRIQRVRVTAP
jgi:hypothetical protein